MNAILKSISKLPIAGSQLAQTVIKQVLEGDLASLGSDVFVQAALSSVGASERVNAVVSALQALENPPATLKDAISDPSTLLCAWNAWQSAAPVAPPSEIIVRCESCGQPNLHLQSEAEQTLGVVKLQCSHCGSGILKTL